MTRFGQISPFWQNKFRLYLVSGEIKMFIGKSSLLQMAQYGLNHPMAIRTHLAKFRHFGQILRSLRHKLLRLYLGSVWPNLNVHWQFFSTANLHCWSKPAGDLVTLSYNFQLFAICIKFYFMLSRMKPKMRLEQRLKDLEKERRH